MTKPQFSRAVKAMTNSLISIPDEIWGEVFPSLSMRVGDTEVYMGLRPITKPYEGNDSDD